MSGRDSFDGQSGRLRACHAVCRKGRFPSAPTEDRHTLVCAWRSGSQLYPQRLFAPSLRRLEHGRRSTALIGAGRERRSPPRSGAPNRATQRRSRTRQPRLSAAVGVPSRAAATRLIQNGPHRLRLIASARLICRRRRNPAEVEPKGASWQLKAGKQWWGRRRYAGLRLTRCAKRRSELGRRRDDHRT